MINENNKHLLFLCKDTKLEGKIESEHNLYLAGHVKGDITSHKDIYVLKGAKLFSNIQAENIQIFGLIEGNVSVKGTVVMNDDARVFGNIKCQSLRLEEGAIYSGNLEILN